MDDFSWAAEETLVRLEVLIQTYGTKVSWWGTCDSPHFDCYGIRLDRTFWLILSPHLKGVTGQFITVVPSTLVQFQDD